MPSTTPVKEAFKERANIISLAATAAVSAACLHPLPLLVGLVAEAAYLLFVPDSGWYTRLLHVRSAIEAQKCRELKKTATLPTLCPGTRERYLRLEQMSRQISQKAECQQWFAEAPHKFDYLLDKFLVFATKEAQFSQYLVSVHEEVCGSKPSLLNRHDAIGVNYRPTKMVTQGIEAPKPPPCPLDTTDPWVQQAITNIRAKYTRESEELQALLTKEQDRDTKAVLEKRVEILQRRADFLNKIEKALTNLTHQLQLLEDTFGLINDEISARSPEQVLEDINDVISQTDSMAHIIEELAPYEQMVSHIQQTA
ncbi:MAG TPA: hypothetical protein VGL77_00570 [Armatimonadota bacterium]